MTREEIKVGDRVRIKPEAVDRLPWADMRKFLGRPRIGVVGYVGQVPVGDSVFVNWAKRGGTRNGLHRIEDLTVVRLLP